MKILKKLKLLIQEVLHLITNFFQPYGIQDSILNIPQNVKQTGTKIGFLSLSMTIISLAFSFLLKLTNMMIEHRLILIGIIFFMLYRGQQVIREGFWIYRDSERQKYDLIFDDEIIFRGSQIVGKVANKVLKYDESQNLYKVMSNESILNSIKQ